jgi:alpha-beta hydrolase superfamily lysophospholipase
MKHKKRARSLLGPALGAAGLATSALGLTLWYANNQINPLPRREFDYTYTFTPWELQIPFEDITLHTSDNLRLSGWWMPRPQARSVIIGCHGHLGYKPDLLGIGSVLWRDGHSVLLFDFRGRGTSERHTNTLCNREVDDLLTAVAHVRARMPHAPIGVIGFSMGASVALLAAAQERAISAVVADSPFTTARDVVGYGVRQVLPFGSEPLVALLEALIAQRYGYRLSQVRPIDAAGKLAPRPLLLIHSTEDSIIPVEHVYRCFAAASEPKELWVYEGVEHCGAYFADRDRYAERVRAFFRQYLCSIEQPAHAL